MKNSKGVIIIIIIKIIIIIIINSIYYVRPQVSFRHIGQASGRDDCLIKQQETSDRR